MVYKVENLGTEPTVLIPMEIIKELLKTNNPGDSITLFMGYCYAHIEDLEYTCKEISVLVQLPISKVRKANKELEKLKLIRECSFGWKVAGEV